MRIAFGVVLILLSGCATTDGVGRYRIESIGNAKHSIEAIILSTKPVLVKGRTTGTGTLAGGTTGGVVASMNSDNPAIIIAGIVGGMVIGNAIEDNANTFKSTEYVIKTSTGAMFTVVQVNMNNPIFRTGDKVILVYGYPSRLIKG